MKNCCNCFTRFDKKPYHRDEIDEVRQGSPLDFSFNRLKCLDEIKVENPRSDRILKCPPLGPTNLYYSRSLWLSYNKLTSLRGLVELVNKLLEQPLALAWIDLSFNKIRCLDDELFLIPNLRTLYLHGNCIFSLVEVSKLRKVDKLRNLTLQGNPLESMHKYRSHVVNTLTQLTKLDFVVVCEEERQLLPSILPYVPPLPGYLSGQDGR
uniref:Leucine-rich repeat-containing protein 51 n=1 Tax=Timema tahoe TaxID=61484 RepID=A0A7R9FK82_9NEOP|nr:unnamed protein product [Timema tahoe]